MPLEEQMGREQGTDKIEGGAFSGVNIFNIIEYSVEELLFLTFSGSLAIKRPFSYIPSLRIGGACTELFWFRPAIKKITWIYVSFI